MDEKTKMLKGELYNPKTSNELLQERLACKKLCFEYNSISPDSIDTRRCFIKQILGETGDNIHIESSFYCDYGYNISVGENFYANHNLVILDPTKVEFGDNVFVGPNCGFYTAEHPLNPDVRNLGFEFAKPIKVGNNVWFGGNVTVIGGVRIGDNVVIGAGSTVTKDIPDNVVVVGNPARIIKEIL